MNYDINNATDLAHEIGTLLALDTDLRERGIVVVPSRYSALVAVAIDDALYTVVVEEVPEDD